MYDHVIILLNKQSLFLLIAELTDTMHKETKNNKYTLRTLNYVLEAHLSEPELTLLLTDLLQD